MDKFPSKAEAAGLGMMVKTNVRHGHTHRDHACTHRHTDTHTYVCTHSETHTHAHICTYAHPDTHAHAHNAHTGTHAHAHETPRTHALGNCGFRCVFGRRCALVPARTGPLGPRVGAPGLFGVSG